MATTTERPLADALTAIKTRRSVKEYLPTEIPREWIEELLDAAHWAPNHKLTHPWRFHVFTGEGRERLVSARQAAALAHIRRFVRMSISCRLRQADQWSMRRDAT